MRVRRRGGASRDSGRPAGEHPLARREGCLFADRANDGAHRTKDDERLVAVDEVVAAQREGVGVVGRESCQLCLHHPPQSAPSPIDLRREILERAEFSVVGGGKDDQGRVTQ